MLFGSSRGRLRGDGVCAFSPLSGSTTVVVFSWYLAPAWRWGLLFLLCSLQRRYVKMQNAQRTLFFRSLHMPFCLCLRLFVPRGPNARGTAFSWKLLCGVRNLWIKSKQRNLFGHEGESGYPRATRRLLTHLPGV